MIELAPLRSWQDKARRPLSAHLQCRFARPPTLPKASRTQGSRRVIRSGCHVLRNGPLVKLTPSLLINVSRLLTRVLPLLIGGCASVGPTVLDRNHLDYAQAVADAEKTQTLLNIVRLRYADTVTFLSINQVVASYSLRTTGALTGGINTQLFGQSGSLQVGATYTDMPTMTFSPITGAQLAESFVRPLSPDELFPPAQNGVPIGGLLRLAVQSIGDLNNSLPLEYTSISSSPRQVGSPAFFKLLADLQSLQDGGALGFRFTNGKPSPRVYLSISSGSDSAMEALAAETRSLLHVGPGEIEIVYGRTASRPNQVAMITRSVIGILTYVSAQIDVPAADVEADRTLPSIGYAITGQRPSVIVHTSPGRPGSAFVAVQYRDRWFWISDSDFASKVAFSGIQNFMNIAQGEATDQSAPILTIPAAR